MSTIVTRAGKGSALTHNEVDANFVNLNTDKLQSGSTAAALTITSATINGGTITGVTTLTTTGNTILGDASTDTLNVGNGGLVKDASGNVGIGTTSPTEKLVVANTGGSVAAQLLASTTGTSNLYFADGTTGTDAYTGYIQYNHSTNAMSFGTNSGNERMRLDSSGNLGLGVTPSAWRTAVGTKALQIGGSVALFSQESSGTYWTTLTSNAFQNTSNVNAYINTGFATSYTQTSGQHIWGIAPSGTAGTTATFTQAMTLDASGNLGIGVTSITSGNRLQVSGGRFSTVNTTGTAVIIDTNATEKFIGDTGGQNGIGIGDSTKYFYVAVANAERMRINASGNLGIGTATPATRLDVSQANAKSATGVWQTQIFDSTSQTTGVGGGISFSGYKTAQSSAEIFAAIDAYKENSTAGNAAGALRFHTQVSGGSGLVERMRIDSSGNVSISSGAVTIANTAAENTQIFTISKSGTPTIAAYLVSVGGWNGAASGVNMGRNSSTSRSISAGGSINANGADYAEYMTKSGDFTIAKGDVAGIDADGKLTNVFLDAITFVVKSTDPSYVGGDSWGSEEKLGVTFPKQPVRAEDDTDETFADKETQYIADKANVDEVLEAARQLVDRIAFAGQVPVNVLGATAGQYIIPVNENGAIKGEAVTNPTFEQYQTAVGKVIAIEDDGRARIIVKVA